MQIFEYPYIIITGLVICLVFLGIGIFFALRGIKTVNGKEENDFINLSKLGKIFEKSAKLRAERGLFYISVSLDNFRSLYSAAQTAKIASEIELILLDSFPSEDGCAIAQNGEKNYIAFAEWDMQSAREKTEALFSKLNKCFLSSSALNIVDIRIGSYFAFGTQVEFDCAISRAKQACMLAKNQDLPYAEWNVSDGKALEQKIKIENNIEKEIDNNRFFLEYQPVIDAKTKKVIGAEVLSRLNSESEGVLAPGSFLSAVNSVGLNDKFDYYIFEKNCKWIANDKKQREAFIYTINFSRATLCDPQFADNIIAIANKYDLNLSCLQIELLEDKNIVGQAREQMIKNLSTLKQKGITVLLDDFGSGYTTFDDLQNLDISIVKIDRSITHNSVTDTGFIILKNIIKTSKDIGFKVLCEGVETAEQEEAVISAGCDLLQGFYYYKPMPVAQLEKVFDGNL